ncbi:hypothetical protein ACTFIY_000416 [Dictyostelium cf. discoideum]
MKAKKFKNYLKCYMTVSNGKKEEKQTKGKKDAPSKNTISNTKTSKNTTADIRDTNSIINLNESFVNLSMDDREDFGQNSTKLFLSPIKGLKNPEQDPSTTSKKRSADSELEEDSRSAPYQPSTPNPSLTKSIDLNSTLYTSPSKPTTAKNIPTITIVNELNSHYTIANNTYPGSIISVTKRGDGIGIVNHNNKLIQLKTIHIIEGRAIIADINFLNTTTRILALYAPADPKNRKLFSQTLSDYYHRNYISTKPVRDIEIIAGDFNCLDFNDHNDDGQSLDELASLIESIRITNSLVDTNFEKNYNNFLFKNITPPTTDSTPLSDHNFLSTSFKCNSHTQNNTKKRWRLKKSSILSYQMISKIDQILDSLNSELKNEPNSFKFSHLTKTIETFKSLFTDFQKQNDHNSKILVNNLKNLLTTDMRDQAFSSLSAINHSKKLDLITKK